MAVVVVGVLYFARDVLVPIVLAVLMSFVLAPLIALLQRLRCPRILAVFLVVLAAFSVLFALGGLMAAQVNQLATDLPAYQSTLREKIQALRGAATGTGTLERASEVLQSLRKELERPKPDAQTPASPGDASIKPIPVEVRQPDWPVEHWVRRRKPRDPALHEQSPFRSSSCKAAMGVFSD
jgi:hypothetical protein